MPLLNSVIKWINIKRNYQLQYYQDHPFEIQNEILLSLLNNAEKTEWGIKHKYSKINSVEDFQKAVPLQDYNDIKPFVDRLRQGEKDLLWPGEVKWFAKSSGTTSDKSKFIPVTKESLEDCHLRGPKDVFAQYIKNHPDTNMLKGKMLTLGGSHRVNNFSNNSYYGDLSAIMIENVPFWSDFIRTPTTEIALIEAGKEDAAFYFEMLRDSLDIKMDKGEFLFQQKDLGL